MHTNKWLFMSACSLITTLLLAVIATGTVPGLISYQGRLTTASGDPVSDGAYFVRFQIYDAPVGGTSLWNSNIQPVQTKDGVYTYVLGQDVPFPNGLFSGGNRWLGVTVGVDPELSPRQQFLAAPFTFVSQNADSVNWSGIKGMPAGFADGIDHNSDGDITAVNTSGGLTGGATSGDANISVASGGVTSTHIANNTIVDADISASANIAASKIAGTAATLSGTQTFTGGNTFTDSLQFANKTMVVTDGRVTVGRYSPFFGTLLMNAAVSDTSSSPVQSLQVNAANYGTGDVTGVSSIAWSIDAPVTGVSGAGLSNNSTRYGGYFNATSASSPFSTGFSIGTKSTAFNGEFAIGVRGEGWFASRTIGVEGTSYYASLEGVGVRGYSYNSPNNIGTYGGAHAGNWGAGVFGEAWENTIVNWAGYFGGDVNVTGTVFSPVKASRIDHPLDPDNKYLQFCDIQSADMMNILSGNVVTDNSGDAIVNLPDYFSAVNTDFRYQLTVIGQFAQAIVASKIANNQFRIKSNQPGIEVSWQVTGIRNDKFAEANRIATEPMKLPHEVGKYLHPELYGFDYKRGMTAEIRESVIKAQTVSRSVPAAVQNDQDK